MSHQFIILKLESGPVYKLPIQPIIDNRAAYYHKDRPEEFPTLESAIEDTKQFFSDTFEIREWALNNMDWDDLLKHMAMIGFVAPEQDFSSAEWKFVDEDPAAFVDPSANIFHMPLELLLGMHAQAGESCTTAAFSWAPDSPPFSAISIMSGEMLPTYIAALESIAENYRQDTAAKAQLAAANDTPKIIQ